MFRVEYSNTVLQKETERIGLKNELRQKKLYESTKELESDRLDIIRFIETNNQQKRDEEYQVK